MLLLAWLAGPVVDPVCGCVKQTLDSWWLVPRLGSASDPAACNALWAVCQKSRGPIGCQLEIIYGAGQIACVHTHSNDSNRLQVCQPMLTHDMQVHVCCCYHKHQQPHAAHEAKRLYAQAKMLNAA